MGVMLQGFFFAPGRIAGVPSPHDGDRSIPFWWDHLASQAQDLAAAGFTAIWLPPPLKGASGASSSGYDAFDDYDLGSKQQKFTVPTRYGTREQLERCVAIMRANGIDVYVDLVENQRDGDDGHFNFQYVDAFGKADGGRFTKGPGDFHPHVPGDPGVFTDQFQFGRDLAPINGTPRNHCRDGLLNAADWLTRALDLQGYRLDNAKGVSTNFVSTLLNHGAMVGKFAFGEFADGNLQFIRNWMDAVQHRSAAIDFPLHFALKEMCNNPGTFDMSSLDHAGLAGVDPLGAVTFVENHDTDRGGVGGPIVRNKLLAYAYILTSEGYPSVFYRDYSTDKNCFGLKPSIDPLVHIHEHLATGPTQERWKDGGVFAYERLGGRHLVVGLNKDPNTSRTITVQTGIPPRTQLHDFAGHSGSVVTDSQSRVSFTIPSNNGGRGYVCFAPPEQTRSAQRSPLATTQVYEGAKDLDIKPAVQGERVQVCRVYAAANTALDIHLSADTAHWTQTTMQLDVEGPQGSVLKSAIFDSSNANRGSLSVKVATLGFHSIFVVASNVPAANKEPSYKVTIRYTAPLAIKAA